MEHGGFIASVAVSAAVVAVFGVSDRRADAQGSPQASLVGAWTANRELSDAPPQEGDTADRGTDDRRGSRRGGGGFGGGGFGGGGRRGGGRGGGGSRGGDDGRAGDPDQTARVRAAMRDIMNPPEHLTIVQSDTMIIVTGPDGRTTRLSADGKKIKDDATKIERKTKWDGGKLVSEISGLAGTKITESYTVDPERHQLHLTVQSDNQRRPTTIHRVYDADNR
jgi:hypothetical protein